VEAIRATKEGAAMKTAAIYCRVSTEDQEREGTSLQTQLEACHNFCRERGYQVAHQVSEAFSGLTLDRPRLNELRELVRIDKVDVVVVYCLDRWTRDPVHGVLLQDELERHMVKLEAVIEEVDSTELGKLISYIRGYTAKLEAEKIRERTQRGIMQRVRSGKLPSGQRARLYGYTYADGKRYINETEAGVVRDMFKRLAEGETMNSITLHLRAMGIPRPSGEGPWNRATVYRILGHPAYIGKTYVYYQVGKGKGNHVETKPYSEAIEIPGATPAIIPEHLFNQAQAVLKHNKFSRSGHSKYSYLLQGHMVCSRCGRKYRGFARTRNGVRYYYCSGRRAIVTPIKCDNLGFRADYIEDIVWDCIQGLLTKPEAVMAGINATREAMENQDSANNELEKIKLLLANRRKQRGRIFKSYYIVGDEAQFRQDLADLERECKQLEDRQTELQNRIEANRSFEMTAEGIRQACQVVLGNMKSLSYEDKCLAIEALQVKVLINCDDITIEGAIPVCNNLSTLAS
jgi:site-specific DNA recombinase